MTDFLDNLLADSGAAVPVTIEPGDVNSPEVVRLLAACCAEIDVIYGNTEPMAPEIAGIDEPGAAFVLARENERAVGCGAIRPHTA
ncbi:MAG: hypothetical protein H0V56_08815, partial [Chthoniobacterales bacterium]|nr:hypothetical protein [Chthoniobacterales bacterium]